MSNYSNPGQLEGLGVVTLAQSPERACHTRCPRSLREEALDKLLGGSAEEELEQELSPSPFRLQTLLTVRGHAYAMCGVGHLWSWSLCVSRFMEFYAATVGEHFRPPNLAEAEEADQQARRENLSLCFSGASLDDAISSVVVDRDMLRHLLVPRPKLPKPPKMPSVRREDLPALKRRGCASDALPQKKPNTKACLAGRTASARTPTAVISVTVPSVVIVIMTQGTAPSRAGDAEKRAQVTTVMGCRARAELKRPRNTFSGTAFGMVQALFLRQIGVPSLQRTCLVACVSNG